MQFTLRFLLLTFLLVALCFAVFDWPGLAIGLGLMGVAMYVRGTRHHAWVTIGVVLLLGFGLLILEPAADSVRDAAKRTASVRNLKLEFTPSVSQVALGLRNYHACFGSSLPPVQERDAQGQPRHSWRALILQGQGVEGCGNVLATRYDFDEAWNGSNNRKLASEDARHATCLAVVGEDGDWLRPTAGFIPVQVVESRDLSIRWLEPRDLTVDEACQAIHVPLPSGPLARRLVSEEEPADRRAFLVDGTGLRIPAHTPPHVLRAALLGDRAKQRELELYRGASGRLRWFDYLTLAGLVACWVAMTRARPNRPEESGEKGREVVGWVERTSTTRSDAERTFAEAMDAGMIFNRASPTRIGWWGEECRKVKCRRNDEARMTKGRVRLSPSGFVLWAFLRHLAFRHSAFARSGGPRKLGAALPY